MTYNDIADLLLKLTEENNHLQNSGIKLEQENKNCLIREKHLKIHMDALVNENEKLRECVEFYADFKTWRSGGSLAVSDNSTKDNPSYLCRGGNLARKTLKALQ